MARYRLLTEAFIDGVRHAAGTVVHKPEDWVGPHRAKVAHHETLAEGDAKHGHDEALYERLPEPEPEVDAEAEEKAKLAAEAALAYGITGGV